MMRTSTRKGTVLALLAGLLLLTPAISEAQRRSGGSRGGRGFDRGYYGGYGLWYGGYPGYGYGYGDYPGYYGDTYPIPQNPQPSYQSNYYAPPVTDPNSAAIMVRVADPNAEVWVNNHLTRQKGTVRNFETTPPDPGTTYTYQLRARWMQNGQEVDQTRNVPVHAGQQAMVDFTTPAQTMPPAPIPTTPGVNPTSPGVMPQPGFQQGRPGQIPTPDRP